MPDELLDYRQVLFDVLSLVDPVRSKFVGPAHIISLFDTP